jgi:hypothetical protein
MVLRLLKKFINALRLSQKSPPITARAARTVWRTA